MRSGLAFRERSLRWRFAWHAAAHSAIITVFADGLPGSPAHGAMHAIYLHHDRRVQDRAAEALDHQGHLAVVLPGREDRPAWREWLGQIDGSAHHGRRRHRVQWRGAAAARYQDR